MKRPLLIAFFILDVLIIALILGGYFYLNPRRGSRLEVDPHKNAYIEQVHGTTVLHLKGSGYEMGFQHGALAKNQVRAAMARFDRLLDRAREEVNMPRFATEIILDAVYRWCSKDIPERYKREMEGLADGAGVPLQHVRRVHVISVVTERACSVFAIFGTATADGKTYLGRNFDWIMDAGLQKEAALILYEPEGYEPFASAGYLGLVGVLSGMNMDKIAIGQIGAISKDSDWEGIPMMLLLRRVLEEARSLEEAVDIVKKADRTVGYNYVFVDGKTGEGVALETTANHCAVFRDNDPAETVEYALPIEDAVFRADEAMDQTVRSFQTCAKGYPNMPYGSNSYDHRYKGMASRIRAGHGKITEETALQITRDVAMRNVNLHSVLCNCTDLRLWVAHAKGTEDAWKQEYIAYDIEELLKKPQERTP
ncbi:MAG: C45 family peptidase [Candidatus Hydrogenedentota bacterium]